MVIQIITLTDGRARVVVNGAIIATAQNIDAARDIARAIVAAENERQCAVNSFYNVAVQELTVKH